MARPAATAIVVTYNSAAHIGSLLESLLADEACPQQVVVVDNASTDSTVDIVSGFDVELVRSERNLGLAAGCHLGVEAARQPVLLFLSPDVTVEPGWALPLLDAIANDHVGAACSTLELVDRPGHINSTGGTLTYFGIAWASDVGAPIADDEGAFDIPFTPGAAMAISRDTWDLVGGFRPDLEMYQEDVDLGWRLRTVGLRSVRVAESRVHHQYEFSRHAHKMFLLERNRLAMMGANYRQGTLVILLPALLAVELGVLVVAIRDGWWRSKVAAWPAAWRMRRDIRRWRTRVQGQRSVGDAALIAEMSASFTGISQLEVPAGAGLATRFLDGYRRLVLPLIRRGDRRRGLA